MKNESKTLFIPLYGKAMASRRGLVLHDETAEKIVTEENVQVTGKSRSPWLALNMAMRSAQMDRLCEKYAAQNPGCAVICPGCGLDSRVLRTKTDAAMWYDLDFPDVIELRRRWFSEDERHKMLAYSVTDLAWLDAVDASVQTAVVVAEGLVMYLQKADMEALFLALQQRFSKTIVIMDAYTSFAVRASRRSNPINTVGASVYYGLDDADEITSIGPGIRLLEEPSLTPADMVNQLPGGKRWVFRRLFCGALTGRLYRKLYRLFVFEVGRA